MYILAGRYILFTWVLNSEHCDVGLMGDVKTRFGSKMNAPRRERESGLRRGFHVWSSRRSDILEYQIVLSAMDHGSCAD